jgi:outer membrane protein assembly factor BamB
MKIKGLTVGILFLLCFSLIFPVTNSYPTIQTDKNKIMEEQFLVDRDHNSENTPDEPTVFPFASSGIKDLIQTQIGTRSDPMDSQWPVASHDIYHTGRSPYNTAATPFVEKWRFPGNGWMYGSVVIDDGGTIYFGADDFFAVYSNGSLKWKVDNHMDVHSAPAIDENDIIYAGTAYDSPNRLYAFYPNGTVKWSYVTGNHIFSSPVIGEDGTIYFGDNNGNLNALYPNGTLKWSTPNIYSVFSSPAIGEDGTIYCTSWSGGNVYAIYPNNGTIKWQFLTGGQTKANPSIAEDGTIYVSSWDDYLYALYPNNGTMKWRVNTNYGSSNNPSIGPDGTIYVAHVDLYAVNPNGTVKWIFPLGDERHCSFAAPAISADGIIYIGANIGDGVGGELIVVNPDGTERWRSGSICNEGIVSSPAIAEDGTVYVGSLNDEEVHSGAVTSKGFIHAFGPGNVKKAIIEQPIAGMIYFRGKELLPSIRGRTTIIQNITVQANATNVNELDRIGFFVDGNLQYNSTEPPFEWNMNKDYYPKILSEHHRIRVTAFYKGGCEWSVEQFVHYIHFRILET